MLYIKKTITEAAGLPKEITLKLPLITLGLSGAAALITLFMAVVLSGYRPVSVNGEVFRHVPRAAVYGLLYPACVIAMMYAGKVYFADILAEAGAEAEKWVANGWKIGFFAGFAVQMLAKTPFRRSSLESRRLLPSMLCLIALSCAAVGATFIKGLPMQLTNTCLPATACIGVSAVISLVLWANIRKAD